MRRAWLSVLGACPGYADSGAALPTAAWRLSRRLAFRRQPAGGLGPPTDAADRWFIEQHELPALQRRQVRDAVLYGRALPDPALSARSWPSRTPNGPRPPATWARKSPP